MATKSESISPVGFNAMSRIILFIATVFSARNCASALRAESDVVRMSCAESSCASSDPCRAQARDDATTNASAPARSFGEKRVGDIVCLAFMIDPMAIVARRLNSRRPAQIRFDEYALTISPSARHR